MWDHRWVVDFGGLAVASGHAGAFADLWWLSLDWLNAAFPACDYRDDNFMDLVAINAESSRCVTQPPAPPENSLWMGCTYVRNVTGEELPVNLCTTSDDSIQVWLNNQLVLSKSVCREVVPECQEKIPVVLPPGVSKIAILLWQGDGGYGFGVGFEKEVAGEVVKLTDGNGDVEFLGPGAGPTMVGQYRNRLGREADPFHCATAGEVRVTLVPTEDFQGPDDDLMTVVETVEAEDPDLLEISDITGGGQVEDVFAEKPSRKIGQSVTWTDVARREISAGGLSYVLRYPRRELTSHRVLTTVEGRTFAGDIGAVPFDPDQSGPVGVFQNAHDIGRIVTAGSTSFDPGTEIYTMTASGEDIGNTGHGDSFHFAYSAVEGDFVLTARIVERSPPETGDRLGRQGLMARYTCEALSKYSMIETKLASPGDEIEPPRHAYRMLHLLRDHRPHSDRTLELYVVPDGTFATEGNLPTWMRIVRRGNAIYSFLAEDADGNDQPDQWCQVGSDSDPRMPETILAGVALTAHTGDTGITGTIRFDQVAIELLEEEPVALEKGEVFLSREYDEASLPPDTTVAVRGAFPPQVIGGRLRLAEEDRGILSNAVWYAVSDALTRGGFFAEFDAFLAREGVGVDPEADPGDGLTFAVIQGRPEELFPECPEREIEPIARLSRSMHVGHDIVGDSNTSVDQNGTPDNPWDDVYTSVDTSCGVLGGAAREGDDFEFAYEEVSGDFEVAIEIIDYAHSTGVGRWSRHGLMARQLGEEDPAEERFARFTLICGQGPSDVDEAAFMNRTEHGCVDGCMVRGVLGGGPRVRFQRLTRRGNVIQGWISNDPGLADGTLDPCDDCNWIPGPPDNWGADAPKELLVGFANNEQQVGGCDVQTVQFRLLPCRPEAPERRTLFVGGAARNHLGYAGGTLLDQSVCHPSFAIEMHSRVGSEQNDPPGGGSPEVDGRYHVGLDVNGSANSVQTNVDFGVSSEALPDIFSPDGIHAEVAYAPTGQIEVWLRANDGSVPRTKVLSGFIPPLEGEIILGFTAGTSDFTATVEVDNLVIQQAEPAEGGLQLPGDCNQDGRLDISDGICFLNFLFLGGGPLPCGDGTVDEPGNVVLMDVNGDSRLDLSDGVRIFNHLFLGGPPPVLGRECVTLAGCPPSPGCAR